jgi:hypothetical protein
MEEPARPKRFEFGVLFVDGIGQQRPGSAVTSLAAALFDWLFRWNRAQGLSLPRSPVLGTAVLSAGDYGPAHLILETPLFLSSDERQARWLIAESSWADAHAPPRFLDLAQWVWKVSTCLLVLQFVIPMRRHWRQYQHDAARPVPTWRRLDSAAASLVYLTLMGVAAMCSVLLSVVLLALAVAAKLPIPRIEAAVQWVVVKLSAVLGDSYLLAHCPVEFAAMRTKVTADLSWLRQQCDVVAVVAHSQGAAIAHQVLRDAGSADGVRAFITAGQGISKLHLLQRMDWDPAARRAAWWSRLFVVAGLLLAGLPALGVIAGRIGVPALHVLSTLSFYPLQIAAGFVSIFIGVRHAIHTNSTDIDLNLALPRPASHLAWTDYYASADPVSNGPLPPAERRAREDHRDADSERNGLPALCKVIYNRGSLLTDHDSYLRNEDQFLPRLVNDLVAAAYGPEDGAGPRPRMVADHDLDLVAHHRRRMIDWLIAARAFTAVAGIALWWLTSGRSLTGPVNRLLHLGDPDANLGDLLARLAAVGIAMIVIYVLVGVIPWRVMERRGSRRFFKTATRYGDQPPLPDRATARPARGKPMLRPQRH